MKGLCRLLALSALFPLLAVPAGASGSDPGHFKFDESSFEVLETAGMAIVTVERSGGEDGAVSVDVHTTGGTAAPGSDYTSISATLSWPDGDGSNKTLVVPILDDTEAEGAETVLLVLSNPTGGAGLDDPRRTAEIVILANDGGSGGDDSDGESDSESDDGESESDSDGESDDGESDSASDGESDDGESDSASDGESDDGESDSASDGESDSESDDGESDGESDGDSDGGGGDDGGKPGTLKFSSSTFQALETSGVAIVTVERSQGESGAVSVDYLTFDGTAFDGEDFTAVAGTLHWAAGDGGSKTLMVPILDDALAEGNESLDLVLVNPTGGAALDPQRSTAVLTVVDDDSSSGCVADDDTLCLLGGRFRVEIGWRTFQSTAGRGRPVALSDKSGLFWFFAPDNFEMLVKVLDACRDFGSHWVFVSATTNLELELTVTDTVSGQTKTYRNPLGGAAEPIQDTTTFGCS